MYDSQHGVAAEQRKENSIPLTLILMFCPTIYPFCPFVSIYDRDPDRASPLHLAWVMRNQCEIQTLLLSDLEETEEEAGAVRVTS